MKKFKVEYRNEITGNIWDTMFDTIPADTEEEAIELAKQWFIDNGEDADEVENWSFRAEVEDYGKLNKYYAYYQENYGDEKFETRDEEENVIVILAANEDEARAAFTRIVDEQIRTIGNEPEENDFNFIVAEFPAVFLETKYCKDYMFDEV